MSFNFFVKVILFLKSCIWALWNCIGNKNSVVLLQKQEAEDDGRDQRALRLQRGPTEAQTEKCQEIMAQKETGEKKLATEREKKGKQARQLAKHQALNQAVSENSGEQKNCSQGLVIHLLLDKI